MATEQQARQQIVGQVEEDHQELVEILAAFLLVGAGTLTATEWAASRRAQKPRVMKQVNRLLTKQNSRLVNDPIVRRVVEEGWETGEQAIRRQLAEDAATAVEKVTAAQAETIKKALVAELQEDLTKLRVGMLRSSDKTLTKLINQVADGVADGAADKTVEAAVTEAVEQLRRDGVAGIIDRSGRRWKPETFTDLCVKTVHSRAVTQGKLDACIVNNIPLVKVVGGGANTCDDCMQLEGVILAVDSPVTPPAIMTVDDARRRRLFHPRCTHSIEPYVVRTVFTAG